MNASSFITFFTYMLRQNVIPFWKVLFIAFNPLSATGPLLGHTYNYVECHGATFGPLVCGLILKLLYYNFKQYGRLYEEKSFCNTMQHFR